MCLAVIRGVKKALGIGPSELPLENAPRGHAVDHFVVSIGKPPVPKQDSATATTWITVQSGGFSTVIPSRAFAIAHTRDDIDQEACGIVVSANEGEIVALLAALAGHVVEEPGRFVTSEKKLNFAFSLARGVVAGIDAGLVGQRRLTHSGSSGE